MKIAAALILFVALCAPAHASTLAKEQMVGSWITQKERGFRLFESAPRETLTITRDFAVTYTRQAHSDNPQILKAIAADLTVQEDLLIIRFSGENGVTFKLVLSGWSTAGTKRLFGMLYLYNKDEGLFNGIPVSFEPHGS